jgi:hypothetical protein
VTRMSLPCHDQQPAGRLGPAPRKAWARTTLAGRRARARSMKITELHARGAIPRDRRALSPWGHKRSKARSASSRGRAPGPPGPLGPPHGARARPRAPPAPVLGRTFARTAPSRTGERALCRGGAYSNPNALWAGSRARGSGGGSVGSPRCARIAITAERSWTSLTIRRRPPHGQASTSCQENSFQQGGPVDAGALPRHDAVAERGARAPASLCGPRLLFAAGLRRPAPSLRGPRLLLVAAGLRRLDAGLYRPRLLLVAAARCAAAAGVLMPRHARSVRHHARPPRRPRPQHPGKEQQRPLRWRLKRSDFRQQLHLRHHQMRRAVLPRLTKTISHPTVRGRRRPEEAWARAGADRQARV